MIIRIEAFRDFKETRKELLWKAHFHHFKNTKRDTELSLFAIEHKRFLIPTLKEYDNEKSFEQMELLGFPLCNPFDLVEEVLPEHICAVDFKKHLGKQIETFGYLVTIKNSKTSTNQIMNFGTLLDIKGDIIDTVHFPNTVKEFPFRGKGVYRLKGTISEEFGYYFLEVRQMNKLNFKEDVRFSEVKTQ